MHVSVIDAGKIGGRSKSGKKAKASRNNGKLGGRPINPIINPDGYSVKGCNFIYAPKGQAGEYSMLAANPYRGCGHKCAYCYVPNVLRMSRPEFNRIANERPGFISKIKADARKYQAAGITEQVMLSFTSDPYHPFKTELTRETIIALQEHGLGVSTLTKGGTRALRDIGLFRPERDSFASTLTSLDDRFSKNGKVEQPSLVIDSLH